MKTIEELEELNHQLQVELRKARAAQAQAEAANQNKSVFSQYEPRDTNAA
jgi:hypothetical protein